MSLLQTDKGCLIDELLRLGHTPPELRLVDVGVSGGIYPEWRKWGPKLKALGVDAIVDEIKRLSREEDATGVTYVAARAGIPHKAAADLCPSTYALHRSSAYLSTALLTEHKKSLRGVHLANVLSKVAKSLRCVNRKAELPSDILRKIATSSRLVPTEANYSNVPKPSDDPFFKFYSERFAAGAEPTMTSRLASVDELVEESSLDSIDFLKVDTDGYELDVLRGSDRVLDTCIGVEVEVQFQGLVSNDANVFCNIDYHLREKGFFLARLQTWNYSRSALPAPYCYDLPAQTVRGPIAWGDALYLRDALSICNLPSFAALPETEQKRKLQNAVLISDLYGLEDIAAELVIGVPQLWPMPDRDVLDFLAAKVYGSNVKYEDMAAAFLAEPIAFEASIRPR